MTTLVCHNLGFSLEGQDDIKHALYLSFSGVQDLQSPVQIHISPAVSEQDGPLGTGHVVHLQGRDDQGDTSQ